MPERQYLRCTVESCERSAHSMGLCRPHYKAHQNREKNRTYRERNKERLAAERAKKRDRQKRRAASAVSRPPVEVVALRAYPDENRAAPHGQRIAVYPCPQCKGEHLVSWGPFNEHPGEKMSTCRGASSSGTGRALRVFVKAPEGGVGGRYDEVLVPSVDVAG